MDHTSTATTLSSVRLQKIWIPCHFDSIRPPPSSRPPPSCSDTQDGRRPNSGTACLEYQNEGVPLSRWGRSGGGGCQNARETQRFRKGAVGGLVHSNTMTTPGRSHGPVHPLKSMLFVREINVFAIWRTSSGLWANLSLRGGA